jgi:hypothetical protein
MKIFPPPIRSAALAMLATSLSFQWAVRGQDFDQPETSGWFVRAGGAARFNVKASISAVPRPSGPGIYDDGFVLPDISGAQSGLTWNWGYVNPSQVEYDVNGQPQQLLFHSYEGVPDIGQQSVSVGNPLLGGEIVGGYHFRDFEIWGKTARFGFEVGYSYFSFSEGMNFARVGTATYTTFYYGLSNPWLPGTTITPPIAPYSGTFAGPGPLLNYGSESDAITSGSSTDAFQGTLKATFHELRLGPSLEIDLSKRLSVACGAGYSSVYADAELRYVETTTFTPLPGQNTPLPPNQIRTATGDISVAKWRPGAYAELLVNYRLTKRIGVFLGGDAHYNSSFTFGDAGHEVTLKLGPTFGAKAGVVFKF